MKPDLTLDEIKLALAVLEAAGIPGKFIDVASSLKGKLLEAKEALEKDGADGATGLS